MKLKGNRCRRLCPEVWHTGGVANSFVSHLYVDSKVEVFSQCCLSDAGKILSWCVLRKCEPRGCFFFYDQNVINVLQYLRICQDLFKISINVLAFIQRKRIRKK